MYRAVLVHRRELNFFRIMKPTNKTFFTRAERYGALLAIAVTAVAVAVMYVAHRQDSVVTPMHSATPASAKSVKFTQPDKSYRSKKSDKSEKPHPSARDAHKKSPESCSANGTYSRDYTEGVDS